MPPVRPPSDVCVNRFSRVRENLEFS
jgi:hypothetical protein